MCELRMHERVVLFKSNDDGSSNWFEICSVEEPVIDETKVSEAEWSC